MSESAWKWGWGIVPRDLLESGMQVFRGQRRREVRGTGALGKGRELLYLDTSGDIPRVTVAKRRVGNE